MSLNGASNVLRALKNRNYRLFFSAQAVSLTGLWMQRVALGWLVFRITNSTRALGVIDFTSAIPSLFLSPLAGAFMARWDLRKALFITQVLLMLIAAVTGILTLTNSIDYTLLVILSLLMGSVNAIDMPLRQSLVVYMVDKKEDVSNAVALNSSLFNVARLIGPSIAGFTIYRVGEGLCFLLNSMTYIATLFSLRAMRMEHEAVAVSSGNREGLRETIGRGLVLLRAFPPFKYMLLLIACCSIFGFPYIVLMPSMAREVLGGTSKTMGLLLSAVGIGALSGSLLMAARKSPVGLDRWASRGTMLFGAFVAMFALSPKTWIAMLALAPAGFFMVTALIACNTFLQSLVDDEERSRLMGIYIMCTVGIAPVGSLFTGQLAEMIGTQGALFASGLLCILSSFYFFTKMEKNRKVILRAFVKKGYNLKETR